MSKITLFIAVMSLLCFKGLHAQPAAQQTLTIEKMFELADLNSKSIRPATTGIAEAGEAVKEAKNARLPEIDVTLSSSFLGNGCLIERDLSHGMKAPMPHWGNNFAVEVSQIIYSGGAVSNTIALSKLQQENARLNLQKDKNKVHFLVTGYYLDLYKQRNLLQVYDRNITLTRKVLDDLHAKNSEGIVLKNDITRYELLLANLELTRTQINNTLRILNQNLVTTLGLPEGTEIMPDTTLLKSSYPKDNSAYWENTASANSPELKQLELAVKMSRHQEKIAKSDLLPKIALTAANHFDGPITIEVPPIDQNFNYWYVGIGLKYNLSSLLKTPKSVKKQKFATQRTKEQFADACEQVELAVKADYIRYLEAYEKLKTQEKSVELANQNYEVVYNRYANELALITDMLDASNSKLLAETELADAQINIIYNYYKLRYLTGTL